MQGCSFNPVLSRMFYRCLKPSFNSFHSVLIIRVKLAADTIHFTIQLEIFILLTFLVHNALRFIPLIVVRKPARFIGSVNINLVFGPIE